MKTEMTKIEWADYTFNPWRGCTKVSSGCANCYAETLSKRNPKVLGQWGPGKPRVLASEAMWRSPLQWNRNAAIQQKWVLEECSPGTEYHRPRVFCASLADVFDEEAPAGALQRLMQLIDDTPHLDWLLLTKRPENITPLMNEAMNGNFDAAKTFGFHMPNVWLGISVENQEMLRKRIIPFLSVCATVHFLSCEPLLGPVNLANFRISQGCSYCGGPMAMNAFDGFVNCFNGCGGWDLMEGIDQVIVGGESGAEARVMHPDWPRALRDECEEHGVAFLFKQWGQWAPGTAKPVRGEYTGGGIFVKHDGRYGCQGDWWDGNAVAMDKVGKKNAGRLLDGVEHNGFPIVA